MALNKVLAFISLPSLSINRSLPILPSFSSSACSSFRSLSPGFLYPLQTTPPSSIFSLSSPKQLCRAGEYVFPDPIPEFSEAETERFRTHLLKKLSKKAIFGDSLQEVVEICTEIFNTFLHTEYGGPGTLLVIPFIDMADTINEKELPGGPQAARAAVVWAQEHVDKDWNKWTGSERVSCTSTAKSQ